MRYGILNNKREMDSGSWQRAVAWLDFLLVCLVVWQCAFIGTAWGTPTANAVSNNTTVTVVTSNAQKAHSAQPAPKLLWLTSDITTAGRTAALAKAVQQQGWGWQHVEYPIGGETELSAEQKQALDVALRTADVVWVDAPHSSVVAQLKKLLDARLSAFERTKPQQPNRVLWVGASALGAEPTVQHYLQAGGVQNIKYAVAIANSAWTGAALPTDLPPPLPPAKQGVYVPGHDGLFLNAKDVQAWRATQPDLKDKPALAVVVHRNHFVDGSTKWLDAWLRQFEAQGFFAYAAFGKLLNAEQMQELLEEKPGVAHPKVLVLHKLMMRSAGIEPLWTQWGVPVIATQPYRYGAAAKWEQDEAGIELADVPFYLAQPEALGAIDPVLMLAHGEQAGASVPEPQLIERQADAVARKAKRMLALQTTPNADKKLALMVYNYPAGATNFGASFLNVPRSLEQVSGKLAEAGYTTRQLAEQEWIGSLQPLLGAYYADSNPLDLLKNGQAAALPLAEYQTYFARLPVAVQARVKSEWGEPSSSRYVVDWKGGQVFVIPRLQIGNLAVLPQPPREETLYQNQKPFGHRTHKPLSHHYLALYYWARQHHAVVHFGTHGTQEWAAGKQRGLDVDDDAMLPLGDVPVVYPYIVDNLGEALTAKRRGRATMVSHQTPSYTPAGFAQRMARMHEIMHEWETVAEGPTRKALEEQLIKEFVEHKLDRDLGWSAEQMAADFEGYLHVLHPFLDEMAQSSQPQGLAVFGQVQDAQARRMTILQTLRKPLIEALGEDIDEAFLIDYKGVAQSRPAQWLNVALQDAKAASMLDLRPKDAHPHPHPHPHPHTKGKGRQTFADLVRDKNFVPNRAARKPTDRKALLKLAQRAQELEKALSTNQEMQGLLTALNGKYLPAAYGGDPIRNPESLPTGRNLTGLDPSRLPTKQAYAVAETLFSNWYTNYTAEHNGTPPQRMALSLWAGETLRHQGIMEAQALVAMGVRPVWDNSGKPRDVELIATQELGRPRVDVMLSITGSWRDQFPNLMMLIDKGVALAATADAGKNAIAQNTQAVAAALRKAGVPAEQAQQLAQVRSFGNTPGDYGTGISRAVQSDELRKDDARLGQMFIKRMSQPFLNGKAVAGVSQELQEQAFGAHLRTTDAAVLSRSSHLFGMLTSDDPFQYLGGLSAAARAVGSDKKLDLYVAQLQDVNEVAVSDAKRNIALELQSRYLHPGWIEAQKKEGYAGTLQVLKAVQFTAGWQAVEPDSIRSDHWQSFFDVFVQDKHKLGVQEWLRSHPQAYAQTLRELVRAEQLGHWQADDASKAELQQIYQEMQQQQNTQLGIQITQTGMQAQPVAAAEPASADNADSATQAETVEGVLLEKQTNEPTQSTPDWLKWLLLLGVCAVVLGGAFRQYARRK